MVEGARSEAKGTLTYGLDPVGNRQSLASTVTGINQQSASYNVNDQVLANTYDANGNTLGANGKSYAYDSMDRMTSFNNSSVKMVYDGDGNRVAKTAGGVTTQYLVDELNPTGLPQVMDEVVKSGAAQRTYLYGLRRISQTQVAAGTTSYYGYDAHGDVRYLMNNGGVVTDTYDYDAFGNVVWSTGTTPNVYRYQGEALDAETGLYYMRARYYDPTVGRFLNVDPMTDQGEHPYEYAAADPVNGHDPTGEQDVIEYSLLMWLYTAHVPPPRGYMSCQGGILFSGTGSGSGGGSGMQADASAGKTMSRVEMCQAQGGGRQGGGGQGGDCSNRAPCPVSADSINQYIHDTPAWNAHGRPITSKPLEGKGDSIMNSCQSSNVDPRLAVAISFVESKWGGDHPRLPSNAFGMRRQVGTGRRRHWTLWPYPTWEAGIGAAASDLNTHIQAGQRTIGTLYHAGARGVWCGTSECTVKEPMVEGQMTSQGGDPDNLDFPCERCGNRLVLKNGRQ